MATHKVWGEKQPWKHLKTKIADISITSMKAARISNFNSRMQIRPVYKTLLSKPYASLKTERIIHKKLIQSNILFK